ncbi:MAG: cell wall metabolism sensor histidine kinase WalK, partial [Anaerolineae bacterium]|nr:cell wall metabolism sensor histidine kinase WalK [Anaerolineae bacterium]
MPIRIRLTLAYTLLLGAILLAFGLLLYLVLSFSLKDQVDRNLKDRALQVGAQIESHAVVMETGRVVLPPLSIFSSPAVFIQVIEADGKLVAATGNLGGQRFPYSREIAAVNRRGQAVFKTVTIEDTPVRIYSAPIIIGPSNQVVGAVQVGQSMKVIETTLRQVLFFLTTGTVVILVISALVGAFLAWAALRPIEKINQTASRIVSAQDLKQRLPGPKTHD